MDDKTEIMLELVRQQGDNLREVIASMRELREQQTECTRMVGRIVGGLRLAGWLAGTAIAAAGVLAAVYFH